MWSCLTCDYVYQVENRREADTSNCPKCGKYQAVGVSFAKDIAEGQWNIANGFFFGSPLGKGLVKGILIAIFFTVARALLEKPLGLGPASERFYYFAMGAGANATINSWLDATGKSKTTGGYWFCAVVYGLIGMCVASAKGVWWGVFWFVYVYWVGLQLFLETVRNYF